MKKKKKGKVEEILTNSNDKIQNRDYLKKLKSHSKQPDI